MIPDLFFFHFIKYTSINVPPGYTDWYGLYGNSRYYNYTLNENGVLKLFSDQEQEYLTDVLVSRDGVGIVILPFFTLFSWWILYFLYEYPKSDKNRNTK